MKLIDKYICQKFFTAFLVMLGIIILLVVFIHLTENFSSFKKHHLPYRQIIGYYCVLLPYMVNLLAPIVVFATTIWVTSRLAQRSEIIALLSSGISFHRIALPYLMIALLLTGTNFYLTGWLLATVNKTRLEFEEKYVHSIKFSSNPQDYIHLKTGAQQYLHIAKYYPYNGTGYNIYLDTFQNTTLIERLYAQKIKWDPIQKVWIGASWKKRIFFPKHEELLEGKQLTLRLAVDPEDFAINPNLKESLTISQLNAHIQNLMAKGNNNVRFFIAEKYIRYMTPFAIIILITLGFLVAIRTPRGEIGTQITLGFILACLYITLFLSAKIVAEVQSSYPLLEIWMPNIIFSLLCMVFYKLVPK